VEVSAHSSADTNMAFKSIENKKKFNYEENAAIFASSHLPSFANKFT
jgi:hypothetical protein